MEREEEEADRWRERRGADRWRERRKLTDGERGGGG